MRIITIFPKDSEAMFNKNSNRTFGGATVQMYLIAKELNNKKDIECISFITNYKSIDFRDKEKFQLVKTFNEDDFILLKFWKYHKKIKFLKPGVILQRGLTLFSCILSFYCYIFNLKFVFMFAHDIESHGIYQRSRNKCRFFNILLRYSEKLIVQNEYEYDVLLSELKNKQYKRKLNILKKGLDFEKIQKSEKNDYDCIWIARCEKWKNPEVFIDLAKKMPEFRFLMICSKVGSSIDFFSEIKKKAEEIRNLKFIDFVDYDMIYILLSKSRTFCITSDSEGDWPMTVLEAAATGLPILSYKLDYGGLLSQHRAGYFCKGNQENLSSALMDLLINKEIYDDMSFNAAKYMQINHSIEVNIEQLIDIIG